MTLEEIHKASFDQIKGAFKLTHDKLRTIFGVKSWHPYQGHASFEATKKRMEAMEKLFRLFASWAYQKGYEAAINEQKKNDRD